MPTASWARPCHSIRSSAGPFFHAASNTPCALNARAPVQQVLGIGEGFGWGQLEVIRDACNTHTARRKWPTKGSRGRALRARPDSSRSRSAICPSWPGHPDRAAAMFPGVPISFTRRTASTAGAVEPARGRGRRSTGTLDRVMQIGVVFPRNEFGGDVGAVGAYAQGVVQLGYPHLLAFDHLVGADPAVHKGRAGPRSADSSPLITAEDSSSRSKRSFRGLDRGSCRDSRASGPARTASRPSWWPASAPLSVRRCSARAAPAPSRGSGRLFDTLKLWA